VIKKVHGGRNKDDKDGTEVQVNKYHTKRHIGDTKGVIRSVNRRRIDNTDKGTKRQPLVHKTLHIKLNIDQHEPL
jgi:hypothetical protein